MCDVPTREGKKPKRNVLDSLIRRTFSRLWSQRREPLQGRGVREWEEEKSGRKEELGNGTRVQFSFLRFSFIWNERVAAGSVEGVAILYTRSKEDEKVERAAFSIVDEGFVSTAL